MIIERNLISFNDRGFHTIDIRDKISLSKNILSKGIGHVFVIDLLVRDRAWHVTYAKNVDPSLWSCGYAKLIVGNNNGEGGSCGVPDWIPQKRLSVELKGWHNARMPRRVHFHRHINFRPGTLAIPCMFIQFLYWMLPSSSSPHVGYLRTASRRHNGFLSTHALRSRFFFSPSPSCLSSRVFFCRGRAWSMRRFNEILKIQWRIRGIAILRDFPETSFHTFSTPWRGCKCPWNKRATANSRFALYVIFSLPNFTDLLETHWDAKSVSFRASVTDLVLRDTLLTRSFYATRIVNYHMRLRWHVCIREIRSHPCVTTSTELFLRVKFLSFSFVISFHENCDFAARYTRMTV